MSKPYLGLCNLLSSLLSKLLLNLRTFRIGKSSVSWGSPEACGNLGESLQLFVSYLLRGVFFRVRPL